MSIRKKPLYFMALIGGVSLGLILLFCMVNNGRQKRDEKTEDEEIPKNRVAVDDAIEENVSKNASKKAAANRLALLYQNFKRNIVIKKLTTSFQESFDFPFSRSLKRTGTSTTLKPFFSHI